MSTDIKQAPRRLSGRPAGRRPAGAGADRHRRRGGGAELRAPLGASGGEAAGVLGR